MLGLMQEWPLLCHKVLDHAAIQHGGRRIVTRSVEGPVVTTTYAEMRHRALKVSQRLERDGFRPGDRIATLAWNTARHVEAWYGIMGIGAIYHTLNPRLFPEQIAWIMNHAEDVCIFVDLTFVPLLEKIAPEVPSLKRVIVLTSASHMPQTSLPDAVAYEEWIGEADGNFAWASFGEETAAGMCYTSGTTGNPKGVVYSHRSNILHSFISSLPDALDLSAREIVLLVVPMFHANSWGIAFSAPLVGASLVLPGPKLDGASIYELLESERVSMTLGVPTVWLMLLQYLEETGKKLHYLKKVIVGGAACPRSMIQQFQDLHGVTVKHAWGMTEMSPIGSMCGLKPEYSGLQGAARLDIQEKQGHALFGIEMKVTDDENRELPWDGKSFGRLKVRGPAVASQYYGGDGAEQFDDENWFDTGDVAHIDEHGYMRVTDRAKDVIKSGGEWISSIELENLAVGHPDVAEAAVIGVPHPTWSERPLLVVVARPGRSPTRESVLSFLEGKVARWWIPDDVAFVAEIPHTAAGKIQKRTLRETFKDHVLPTISAPRTAL